MALGLPRGSACRTPTLPAPELSWECPHATDKRTEDKDALHGSQGDCCPLHSHLGEREMGLPRDWQGPSQTNTASTFFRFGPDAGKRPKASEADGSDRPDRRRQEKEGAPDKHQGGPDTRAARRPTRNLTHMDPNPQPAPGRGSAHRNSPGLSRPRPVRLGLLGSHLHGLGPRYPESPDHAGLPRRVSGPSVMGLDSPSARG